MKKYTVVFKKSAEKELDKINKTFYPKIKSEIRSLEHTPFPRGYKKLQDSENKYRIRIGDYRVIYTIDNNVLIIEIIKVGHRKDVYK